MESKEESKEVEAKEAEEEKEEEVEEKPITKVEVPLGEEVFEPIIKRFAAERGLGEDYTSAALRLAKLLRNAGMDPYESIKTVSEYADKIINYVKKIPDSEATKPMKDAIIAKGMSHIAEKLEEAALEGKKKPSFEEKVNAIIQTYYDQVMPYIVAMEMIRSAPLPFKMKEEEKPREIPIAYHKKEESEDVKVLREMLSKTYDALLTKAFETKTPEEKSELKEILDKISKTLEELKEGGGIKKAAEELKSYAEALEALGLPKPYEGMFPKELPPEQQVELKRLELEKKKIELEDQRERLKLKADQDAEKRKMDYVFKMFKPIAERLGDRVGDIVEEGIKAVRKPKSVEAFTYGMACPKCGEIIEVSLPKKLSGKKLLEALPEEVKCPSCGEVFRKSQKEEK